jgi:hypothetical protein
MTKVLLAEFAHVRALRDAADAARRRGYRLLDALTPFPVEDVAGMLDGRPSKVRVFMFAGGLLVAAMALGGANTSRLSSIIHTMPAGDR